MDNNEIRYLWELLKLALFFGKEDKAKVLASELYEKCSNLSSEIESEVVDYSIRGRRDSLKKMSLELIAEPRFSNLEKFALISRMVVDNDLSPTKALIYISDESVNELKISQKKILSSLLDTAWHDKHDKEQSFESNVDLDALRGEWIKVYEGLKPAILA